ncbi:caspase family protein, partial [candidate division WOR-3 bacterium]|nr:caspase family protein [candidate division WOR-3 bacterium]
AKDAEAMRKYLIEALGYLDGNIITLPDPTSGDLNRVFGTASRPDGQLYNLVSAKPGRCDVFVYYAGHGAPSVREKRGYLVPIDASPDYIEQNGYPLDLFYSNLSKVLAKDLIVVLDACFTGEAPDTSGRVRTLVRDASPVPVASVTEDVPANSLVMTAAKSNQLACWYRDKRHSLFTYWLLRGLKGEADLDRDGRIVVGELDEYVRQNVPPLARLLYNRDQTPEIRGAAGKELLRIR